MLCQGTWGFVCNKLAARVYGSPGLADSLGSNLALFGYIPVTMHRKRALLHEGKPLKWGVATQRSVPAGICQRSIWQPGLPFARRS